MLQQSHSSSTCNSTVLQQSLSSPTSLPSASKFWVCRTKFSTMAYSLVAMLSPEAWMALLLGLAMVLLAAIFFYSSSLLAKRSDPEGRAQLPGGRFWQIPILGETVEFLSGHPDRFMFPRMQKYGKNFRTHLFGKPAVCVTTAEATRFVLQHPELFAPNFPASQQEFMGSDALSQVDGHMHTVYRKFIRSRLTTNGLKYVATHVDEAARKWVADLSGKEQIETANALKDFTFNVTIRFVCEDMEPSEEFDAFRANTALVERAFMVIPLRIPGSAWTKAVEGSVKAMGYVQRVMNKRRGAAGLEHHDLLNEMLNKSGSTNLTDKQIRENIFAVLLAYDTTTCLILWVLYNMCLYPEYAQQVKDEHEELARKRSPGDPIDWEEMSASLPYTSRFLQETLRLVNVASFSPRKAREDVVVDGIFIPKNWTVMAWYRYFHLDPELYPDPLTFDPSRFETTPKFNSFTPFGNGNRVCPGKDLARQQVLIFLHHFLLAYDFQPAAVIPCPKQHFWPIPYPSDGFPLKLIKKEKPILT